MTSNTIAYARLGEERRANTAREMETQRSNLANEAELKRAHLASEAIGRAQVAAQNYATAQNAANVASQVAAQRYATLVNQQLRTQELQQQARLTTSQIAADLYKFNTSMAETSRHNLVTEQQSWSKISKDYTVGMANAAATGKNKSVVNVNTPVTNYNTGSGLTNVLSKGLNLLSSGSAATPLLGSGPSMPLLLLP